MKESVWGYLILSLGLIIIAVTTHIKITKNKTIKKMK